MVDELEENETFTPWHNIWLWACVALITPRNLNIVSNFMNHKIWACVIIDAIFSDYKLVFFKEPEIFQHSNFIFSKSHNLGHQKKGFVGTAEGSTYTHHLS